MPSIAPHQILPLRMASLLLRGAGDHTPHEIATWFGAMQAQDLASSMWSFGVRISGSTSRDIDAAIEQGRIVRTWPMRGTIHFVPPEDVGWMLSLTGARALPTFGRRRARLGLDERQVHQVIDGLAAALSGGHRLTRSRCVALMGEHGLDTSGSVGYHVLTYAAHLGIICFGPREVTTEEDGTTRTGEPTFVLLDEWVPEMRQLSREEALAELALRYFRSHGPTTARDFAGWTGLAMADVRSGIRGAGDALTAVQVDGVTHILATALLDDTPSEDKPSEDKPGEDTPSCSPEKTAPHQPGQVQLLPGFDEYLLGFKDRSAMVPEPFADRIIPGNNGMFRPTIVVDGRVVGTWTRRVRPHRVELTAEPFEPFDPTRRESFESAGVTYGAYLGLPVTFSGG